MTTVRETRINTARNAMLNPDYNDIIGLSFEQAAMLAEDIVHALFPDRTFDNIEVPNVY